MEIALPVIIVGVIALVFGIILSLAATFLSVKTDERVDKILEALPGANCGGCGYSGCQGYANAIVKDGAPTNKCAPGGEKTAAVISELMGVTVKSGKPSFAVCMCHGTPEITKEKFDYYGVDSCKAAVSFFSGSTGCSFGCLGLGDCMAACKFGALRIIDSVARIDKHLCVNCGMCMKACPKGLIRPVQLKKTAIVLCSNTSKGKQTMGVCKGGCIGCGRCAKACPEGAIVVENNLARIDAANCIGCGKCVELCPVHCIALSE